MPLGAATVVIWGTIKLLSSKQKSKISIDLTDWIAIGITIISLAIYFCTGNGKVANIMIQIILFMGFIPLIKNLIKSRRKDEPALPWILFCLGWTITTIETVQGYKSWIEFIYPVINGLIGCMVVLGIAIYNKHFIKKE
jgi:hypothetical protein